MARVGVGVVVALSWCCGISGLLSIIGTFLESFTSSMTTSESNAFESIELISFPCNTLV